MDSDGVVIDGAGALQGRTATARHRPQGVRPRRPHWPFEWIVTAAAVLMLADGAASVLAPTANVMRPVSVPIATGDGPAQAWLDLANPPRRYGLSGSVFARLPLVYAARRKASGNERLDTLTYGAFDSAAPYLRLAIHRTVGPTGETPDLLVALARLAATEALAVTRLGPPLNQMTRFGLFDTADITVQRGSVIQSCLGFRMAAAGPIAMSGLACGGARPLDRPALGCMLDHIDLVSAGDDPALGDLFGAAERHRTAGCPSMRHRSGETAWIPPDMERR